jgi:hypothetical protein
MANAEVLEAKAEWSLRAQCDRALAAKAVSAGMREANAKL